jgi:hypothetical protein
MQAETSVIEERSDGLTIFLLVAMVASCSGGAESGILIKQSSRDLDFTMRKKRIQKLFYYELIQHQDKFS